MWKATGQCISRASVVGAALSVLMVALTGCSAASAIPSGDGAVVGGIAACVGARELHRPGYVAGTVVVLRGTVSKTPTEANGNADVLPRDRVASQRVLKGHRFRIYLGPGRYVLVAHYAQGDIISWVPVVIREGRITNQTIPSPCI